jgi:beta-phosphoglucomutase-like phosphatase (HAD superfamily)
MAGGDNMDFYKEHFGLLNWFDNKHILFDTGELPSKPDPAIYLKTAEQLGVPPRECVVVEDSGHGIEAARRAGIGYIYAIGSTNRLEELAKIPGVSAAISDFHAVDRTLF